MPKTRKKQSKKKKFLNIALIIAVVVFIICLIYMYLPEIKTQFNRESKDRFLAVCCLGDSDLRFPLITSSVSGPDKIVIKSNIRDPMRIRNITVTGNRIWELPTDGIPLNPGQTAEFVLINGFPDCTYVGEPFRYNVTVTYSKSIDEKKAFNNVTEPFYTPLYDGLGLEGNCTA